MISDQLHDKRVPAPDNTHERSLYASWQRNPRKAGDIISPFLAPYSPPSPVMLTRSP
ncbi:unnamed protein product [Withania somnifera]